MNINDKHNDCHDYLSQLSEAELCLLENIVQKHIPNYQPNLLTQQIDEHFGVTKMTDCCHRYVKQELGYAVY